MVDNQAADFWLEGDRFIENCNRFPAEELLKYAGQYVAWNLEGTRILAAGKDYDDVDEKLIAAGIDPQRVVHSYVDDPDGPCYLGSFASHTNSLH
jgi:hypothetical protein